VTGRSRCAPCYFGRRAMLRAFLSPFTAQSHRRPASVLRVGVQRWRSTSGRALQVEALWRMRSLSLSLACRRSRCRVSLAARISLLSLTQASYSIDSKLASVHPSGSFSGSAKMDGYGGKYIHGTHYIGDDYVTISHRHNVDSKQKRYCTYVRKSRLKRSNQC
jgi:hypothetical protein